MSSPPSSPSHLPHQPPSSHRQPSRAPTTTRMMVPRSPDKKTHVNITCATTLSSRLTTRIHLVVVNVVLLLHLHFGSALHNNNITSLNNFVTMDPTTGKPVGDTSNVPTRTVVGFVQDCVGFTPHQHGTLCGARGAYLAGHYLWVAATEVDAVTAVDLYRPEMPTVAGSVRDATRLKQVVATWMHHSNEFVVALARGRRPNADGHLTLLDVRVENWYRDPSGRFIVKPKVASWLRDCSTSDDPTFPRKLGRMCGARAMHVVEDVAYVVSELSHTLSVIRLPGRFSNDLTGLPPTTIQPEFLGSLQDSRLHGAYAVAVKGINAYVVSRWCKTCVVMVNVQNPEEPKVGGRLQQDGAAEGSLYVVESLDEVVAATHVGFESVARGVSPGAAYAFLTSEFDGRVSVVDVQ